VLKNDVVSYWIKESRDFGIAIKHRTLGIVANVYKAFLLRSSVEWKQIIQYLGEQN